jgi:hypothetical protein
MDEEKENIDQENTEQGNIEQENIEQENKDEISELVGDFETINTIFNEPADLLKNINESFEKESYTTILESSKDLLLLMEQPTQQFIKIGMAFSISAATKWISPMENVGVDISSAEKLISKAREQFTEGDFNKADETIGKVRNMIPKLEEEQRNVSEEHIQKTEQLIEEISNTGADVEEAQRHLQQAKYFMDNENYQEVVRLTREAKETAETSKDQRIQTVSDALLFTRSVIKESENIGVNVSEADDIYKAAKTAFAQGDYQRCSDLTKEAEEKALILQDEQIQKVLELKEKRTTTKDTKPRPPAPPKRASSDGDTCATCGSPVRFVQKYGRNWCNTCKKYTPRK